MEIVVNGNNERITIIGTWSLESRLCWFGMICGGWKSE